MNDILGIISVKVIIDITIKYAIIFMSSVMHRDPAVAAVHLIKVGHALGSCA